MYALYTVALLFALAVSSPWWIAAMLLSGKYREGLAERLGAVPDRITEKLRGRRTVWVHAVSVGELQAASPLIMQLQQEIAAAGLDYSVIVSTTTRTGQQLAREKFGAENVFYFPLDFPWTVDHYLKILRPRMVVLLETEFWPNLLRAAERRQVRVVVVNARISDRSYPRYRALRFFWRIFLSPVSVALAQSQADAARLTSIGIPGERVRVSGNLKYDSLAAPAGELVIVTELRRHLPEGAPVWVCGSTADGEEQVLLAAHKQALAIVPNLVTIIAPRHPERFNAVAAMLPANAARRGQWMLAPQPITPGSVFLLDSIGELAQVYSLASLAFVGGSLAAPGGGQNPLEPAGHGVAVLSGPYMQNFRDVAAALQEAGALITITSQTLSQTLCELLAAPQELKQRGERGRQKLQANQGATGRTVQQILEMLTPAASAPPIRWLELAGDAPEPFIGPAAS
jgi:3-deoxy-D-manno-octulosonic-acid transferase